MLDIYAEVRRLLKTLMQDSIGELAKNCRIQCPGKHSPACTAHAMAMHANAEEWCERSLARLSSSPVMLLGAPLIDTVEAENGYLNFYFSTAAYDAILAHMLEELPPARPLKLPQNEVDYACWRMYMLAHKGSSPFPDDPCVKKAMWLTFGITERLSDARLLKLRKEDAARSLLSMSRHLPPQERPILQNRCGSVAHCALRLLQLDNTEVTIHVD